MTEKEKAKAYDEAIERAKKSYGNRIAEEIFPELKESEDERIKKAIIEFFESEDDNTTYSLVRKKDIISWLKKQGKNSINKIEPRFKVGDWVVNKIGDSWHIDSLDKKNYQVSDGKGNYNYFPISKQNEMHIWNIQDAKDGDVLALSWLEDKNLWEKIIIFKKYHSEGVKGLSSIPCVEGYGNTFMNGKMAFTEEVPYHSKTWTCNLHPATKEQRDLLFQKIKEAGYKWNDETKTLEKLLEHKFDPKTLQPFDKVLVYDIYDICEGWVCALFSHIRESEYPYSTCSGSFKVCIPYNDDTKHLLGTTEEAPEYYRYWED